MNAFKIRAQQHPLAVTAVISILLSVIAITGKLVVGRDAALYLHIAQQVNENNVGAAFKTFSWPWFSILLAYTQKLLHLNYQLVAHIYSVIFAAGISVLLVAITRKLEPKATWWAVLLALSVPAFNTFRYDIIRDTGSWFFLLLSLWVLLSAARITWLRGVLFQLAIIAAALFRLESIFIVASVFLYYAFFIQDLSLRERAICLLRCNSLFLLASTLLLALAAWGELLSQQRVASFLTLVNPNGVYQELLTKAEKFGKLALRKWSYSDAPLIIVSGMGIALLYHQFQYGFLATILLLCKKGRKAFVRACNQHRLLTLAAIVFYLVLLVFYIQRGFENSRYGTPFILLILPLLALMLSKVFERVNKWAVIYIALSCVLALSNVVSTSPSKRHYLEAAQWVKDNTDLKTRLYTFDLRVLYYADRDYSTRWQREFLKMNKNHIKPYDFFLVRDSAKKMHVIEHAKKLGLLEVTHFSNGKTTIYIFAKKS